MGQLKWEQTNQKERKEARKEGRKERKPQYSEFKIALAR